MTREHPDKGGDAEKFRLIQQAYEVLSDADKVGGRWCRQGRGLGRGNVAVHPRWAGSAPAPDHTARLRELPPPAPAPAAQRAQYDATGRIVKSVEEDFMDSFAGGARLRLFSLWGWSVGRVWLLLVPHPLAGIPPPPLLVQAHCCAGAQHIAAR